MNFNLNKTKKIIITSFILVFCFFIFPSHKAEAATRTISVAGGNFNATGTWDEGIVPVAGDAVVARGDGTSGNLTVNVASGGVGLLSFDMTGWTGILTMNNSITVSGTVTLVSGMGTIAGTGQFICNTSATLTSGGKIIPALNLGGTAQTYTLGDDWTVNGTVTFAGVNPVITINGNNLYMKGNLFGSTNIIDGTTNFFLIGTGTVNLNNNSQVIRNNLTINTAGTITFSATFGYSTGTLTYIAGTVANSTLTINGSATLNTNGIIWDNALWVRTAGTTTLLSNLSVSNTMTFIFSTIFAGSGVWTTKNFTDITAGTIVTLVAGQTYTVLGTGTMTVTGTSASHITIKSSVGGVKAILTLNVGATQALSYVNATDIDSNAGQTIYTLGGVLSNTLNWNTFSTEYFVNGGVNSNWLTTSNWAITSGGPGGYSAPSSVIDVIFDANSPNVTITGASQVKSIDFTNYTNTLTINSSLVSNGGNVTLGTGMTVTSTGGAPLLNIGVAGGTLTSNAVVWPYNMWIQRNSTLGDNWTVSGVLTIMTTAVVLNGFTMNVAGLVMTTSMSGTTNIVLNGTGTWSGAGTLKNNLTFNTAGTITVSGTVNYNTGILTYTAGTVVTTGSTLIIGASTTLNTDGIIWNNIIFGGTSTIINNSDLHIGGILTFTNAIQTLTLNGNNIYTANVNHFNGSTVTGTTNIIMNGTGTYNNNGTGTMSNPLIINSTGTVTFIGSVNFTTGSSLSYSAGTVIATTSFINMYGGGSLNIPNIVWGNIQFLNNGPLQLLTDTTIIGNLTSNGGAGAPTINGNTLYVGGGINTVTSGTFGGTTNFVMNGTGTLQNSSASGVIKNNLTINTTGIITIGTNLRYNTGTLTYTSGTVVTTGSTLIIAASTTLDTDRGGGNKITWNNVTVSAAATLTLSSDLSATGIFTASTGAITFSGTKNVSVGALTVSAGTLQIATISLTVTGVTSITGTLNDNSATGTNIFVGQVTVNSGGAWTANVANPAFTFRGGLAVNTASTFTGGTGIYTFDTNAQTISGTQNYTITNLHNNVTTGTGLTFSGAQPTVTTLTQGAGAVLTFSGTMPTITTLTATALGNNVQYTSSGAQNVIGTTYEILTINKSANTATLGGNTVIQSTGSLNVLLGTLNLSTLNFTNNSTSSISGVLDDSSSTGTDIFVGKITINPTGSWTSTGNSAYTLRGGLQNDGTFTSGTNIYTFDTSSQAISGLDAVSIDVVTITTITLTNSSTAGFTITTTLSGTGGLTQDTNASLNLGVSSVTPTLTATAVGNTVSYISTTGPQTIKNTTYNNLSIDKSAQTGTLGGATTVNANFTILSGTLDTSSSGNYSLDTGNISIGASGTLVANNSMISVAGNWTNRNVFTAGGSTVTFNGGTTAVIDGTTTFWNLTITHSSAKEVDFETAGTPIFGVDNIFTVTGHSGQLIKLYSKHSPTRWQFHPTGTAVVNYVDVQDGGCQPGAIIITPTNSIDSGNNELCWGFNKILTFSISSNSVGFGTLSPLSNRYATSDGLGSSSETEAHTISAATNGSGGYIITVQGPSLSSPYHTITSIGGTNTAPNPGTEQFGLRTNVTSGNGTVTSPYAASGFAYGADANTVSQIASGIGDGSTTTYSVRYLGDINSMTSAGNYSTALTYIVTGSF